MTQKKIKLKTINNESIVGTGNFDLSDFVTDDDSRLTDARTPLSHTHGNITSDGKIGSNSGYIIVTSTDGAISTTQTIGAAKVKDSKEHVNIGTLGNATQGTINTAIDTALGNKENKGSKVNTIDSSSTTTQYPSAKAIYDAFSWQLVETKNNGQVNVYANDFMIALSIQDQFSFGANTSTQIATISSQYAPTYGLNGTIHHNSDSNIKFNLDTSGNITVYNKTSATNSLFRVYITYPRKSTMPQS